MVESVMIIGGYGKVGGNIAKQLIQSTDLQILIAGRCLAKACTFSQQLGERAFPVEVDIENEANYESLLQANLVIMCIDQTNTSVVQYCLKHGIHYIDITASFAFLEQIELLKPLVQQSTVILSVGFAPGLSNLLAKQLKESMKIVDKLDITILLGLGEQHGDGAVQWLLEQMNQSYRIKKNGSTQTVQNFSGKKTTYFNRLGTRSSYLFNFSDQHTLQRQMPYSEVNTYLTFDIEWVNRLLAGLHYLNITSLLRYSWARRVLVKIIQGWQFFSSGSDICAIKVEAVNKENNQINEAHQVWYENNEALITANVTSLVVQHMMHSPLPAGIHHLDELFWLDDLF
ncbi:saccharopine dehydrogenase family protein [Gracilibacillus timonensis]|uniref:saccharopine dehydrogenase family protein n=1 Tax=Gracilibacillus timonensis TaxID=1816696 RepID=UPI0008263F74|nr:saccharopine dehydrogenase NADP-binding domain-containing protein [Gracilibacillus timonensis]